MDYPYQSLKALSMTVRYCGVWPFLFSMAVLLEGAFEDGGY